VEDTVPQKYKHLFTSRDENDVPPMGKQSIQDMLSNTEADPISTLFCPVHHYEGLNGLPPTYVQVGGRDCVRDDGVIYAKLLQDAGVETRLDNYAALGHESWTIFTDMGTPTAQALKDSTLAGMKWLLKK
jgi:acetyl esterase/lipase